MKHEEFLQELLQRTKRRLKLMELGAGAVTFLAFLVASLTLGVILDHAFALPKVARWAILLALDASIAIALLVAVVFVLRRLNDVFIAKLIEKLSPGFRNTLVASIEARRLPDIPAGIKEFIEEQAAEKATRVDPLLAVSPRRLVVASYALLLTFLFFFFYSFFSHKSVLVALERIWEPGADIPPATATQIVSVEPGTRAVLAQTNVALPVVVRLRGVIPKRVTLQWSREQELWGSLDLTSAKDGRQWETALADLERDLFYSIQAGDARSPVYHLHVVPTPLVTNLQTHYHFPDYAGLPERVTYRGDVDALDGTVITVQAHTNTTLAQAELLVNGVAVAASVRQPQPGEEPGDTVEGSFTVSRGGFYSIRLTDPFGFTNPDPVRYEVVCRYDQPPAVHILEPRGRIRRLAGQPLALTFEAKDDVGLGSIQFHYKLPQEREERSESLPLPANVREVHNEVTVHLDRLGLEPGQTLACYLQALDTFPEEPHVGRSETLVVAVPLPEELTEAYAQAAAGEGGESAEKGAEQGAPAGPAAPSPETPAGEGQEAENQEPTLEKMLARDETVIDTIRQFLAEDAQAQAAAQPGAQPGAPAGQAAPAATQANTGTAGTSTGQPPAAGQANPQAPAGAAASTPPAPPTPPVTVWPTGEVGEPGQTPLTWPSEVSAASGGAGAVQPVTNPPASGGAASSSSSAAASNPAGQLGSQGSGSEHSGTPTSQTGGAQSGQGAQSAQTQAQASGQQAPSGAAASSGAQGGQQAPSQGSASGQTQGGQGSAQGQSSAGQAGAQAAGQSGSQAGQSASQGGAQPGAQSGAQGAAQPGGQAQAGAAGQSGSQGQPGAASSSAGGGAASPAAGPQQGPAQGEPLNPAQTLQPAGGSGGLSGGAGGGTSGTQPPDLTIRATAATPEGEREKLAVVGQVINQLYDRLLRNDVNPKLLEQLNWNLQDLASWVAAYKAKLDQLPWEKGDAGVLLGEGAAGLPPPEQRVIEMGKSPLDVKPTVGEGTPPISPDEVAQLLQGAKGTVSPEYRTLLEDYYRALADTARR